MSRDLGGMQLKNIISIQMISFLIFFKEKVDGIAVALLTIRDWIYFFKWLLKHVSDSYPT